MNSRVLYDDLKNIAPELHEIRTTTLNADDFFSRYDTCLNPQAVRLLYVGRIDRAKGILKMIEAVALLANQGENIQLDLVGWPLPGDTLLAEIDELARQTGVQTRVNYLGARAMGPELFSCYRNADLFIIASFSDSEGFPRVIWEAMAHSLPVIATRVGSIPAFIEGAAELVEPGSAEQLAGAVWKLIHSPQLRKRYIANGFALVAKNTLSVQSELLVTRLEEWLLKSKT